MSLEILHTPKAPAAIGPYSHGTKCGDFIFTSGQCPFYPETGEVEQDIKKATALALNNVLAIVEAGGGTKESIAKVEIFVRDLADFNICAIALPTDKHSRNAAKIFLSFICY